MPDTCCSRYLLPNWPGALHMAAEYSDKKLAWGLSSV
jgi:hypothetical protein